jgi:hypothetical protein
MSSPCVVFTACAGQIKVDEIVTKGRVYPGMNVGGCHTTIQLLEHDSVFEQFVHTRATAHRAVRMSANNEKEARNR